MEANIFPQWVPYHHPDPDLACWGVIGPIKVNIKERIMRGFPLIKISRSDKLFLFNPFKFFNITYGPIRDLLTRHNFPSMYEAISACLECQKPITENSTLLTGSNRKHPVMKHMDRILHRTAASWAQSIHCNLSVIQID